MSRLIDGLRANVNHILSQRDALGAALKDVYLVTRTWSGVELGDGTATEVKVKMNPSPRVVEFKHDMRLVEGGAVQQGDVLLKMVSKQTFPTQSLVDGSSATATKEALYEIGGFLYRVVNVRERHLTWNVLLRRLSQQARG